jgi:hypothetical protein
VEEALLSLASMGAQAIVTAVVTDAWESVKHRFAGLIGRGDPGRTALAVRRLENSREELTGAPADRLELMEKQVAAVWQTRLLDALEEDPGLASELQVLVDAVWAQLPGGTASAAGHGVAAGRNVIITASGGVAAGVIHGNVMPGNPMSPGPAGR